MGIGYHRVGVEFHAWLRRAVRLRMCGQQVRLACNPDKRHDSPPNDCFFGPSVFTLYARRVVDLVAVDLKGHATLDDLAANPVVPQAARCNRGIRLTSVVVPFIVVERFELESKDSI